MPGLRAASGSPLRNGNFAEGKASWWGEGQWDVADHVLTMRSGFACQDRMPVQGGQRYRIGFEARGQGGYVQLSYRGGTVKGGWFGPATVTLDWGKEKALAVCGDIPEWTAVSVVVQAPQPANQMLLYLRRLPKSDGAVQYRKVTLEPTDEPVSRVAGLVFGHIRNADFSQGKDPWWGEGTWTVENGALRISDGFACQDGIAVEPGKRYKLSLRIKADGAPADSVFAQASYRGEGVSQGWVGGASVQQPWGTERALLVTGGTRDWAEFSCVIAPPENADTLLLYLRKKGRTDGMATYDDVTLVETDEPETTAARLRRTALAATLFAGPAGDGPYRIAVGAECDLLVLNAAKDLAEYLGRITGKAFLPLVRDTDADVPPRFVVGRDNAWVAALCPDVDWGRLGPDGFVVRSVGEHVVIAGNTPGGTMYGVNWFLDRKVGVKWLAPDYEHVPAGDLPPLGGLNEVQIPRFGFRQILGVEGQDKAFAARNLLNGNSHGAYGILPKAEINHFDGSWQRPGFTGSFYQLLPDAKQYHFGGQVKMMDEGCRAAMAEAIVRKLRTAGPDYGDLWFGFMDNDWGWDMDPASKAFADRHGGVPSAPRLDMAIDVLRRVQQSLPRAKLAVNAYHWSFPPPTGIAVPEDLLVFPMTIQLDYSTPLFAGRNRKLGQDLQGWNAISRNLLLWDHIVNFHGYLQPTPNLYPIAETIRWLDGLENIRGYFAEASWNTKGSEFASLRTWMMARLLWNPKLDFRREVATYCDLYYGPAGKLVAEYIDFMHATSAQTRSALWEKTNVDAPMLTLDFVTKADALLAQAAGLVQDHPQFLKHVNQVRVTLDYVVLCRRQEFEREAAKRGLDWTADRQPRTARLKAVIQTEGITQYRQGGSVKELFDIIGMERKEASLPQALKDVPPDRIKEVQDLGFNRYFANTVLVQDELASDGVAARIQGNVGAWVIQAKRHLIPEEGEWDVYAEIRIVAKAGTDAGETLAKIGSAPPMDRYAELKWKDFGDGQYHLVKAEGSPLRYTGDEGAVCYVATVSKQVEALHVDRFLFVRVR